MAASWTARKDKQKPRLSVVGDEQPEAPQPQPQPQARKRLTPQQFISTELAQIEKDSLGILTRNVGEVAKAELVNLINISSSLKARYMISLLDMSPSHAMSSRAHMDEIRDWRERYEELDRGIDMLKRAVLDGTLKIKGLEGSE